MVIFWLMMSLRLSWPRVKLRSRRNTKPKPNWLMSLATCFLIQVLLHQNTQMLKVPTQTHKDNLKQIVSLLPRTSRLTIQGRKI